MDSGELDQTVAAWLADHVDHGETIRQSPQSTIVPKPHAPGTTAQQAVELLRQLAKGGGTLGGGLEMADTIGEGGMGVVRMAEQRALGRKVAVKTLRPERQNDAAAMDLLYEGWVTGALEHPNVVPVYNMGLDHDGRPVIVFKKIEGVEWTELIDDEHEVQRRFGQSDLLEWNLEILIQVLNAVRFAHSRGIIHRDLKPDNVMIGEFGEVYVLDWGIAVSIRDDRTGRLPLASEATQMAGTPCYMAPEMLGEGTTPLSERTDVYLCGAILHEILTGEPPHNGDSAVEVVTSVATSDPKLPDYVPPHLARICRRAMDRDPEGRFESAEQMRLAIHGYLQHRGSQRLVERAERTLSELLSAIQQPDQDEAEQRQLIYKLFGECRFGFQEAIRAWPGNPSASEGLRWAIGAMIEHELTNGDARAAANLMAELDDPPDDLRQRVQQALADRAADQQRREELEAMERDLDTTIGSRTRTFLMLVMGIFFVGIPLSTALGVELTQFNSHLRMAGFSAAVMAFGTGLFVWARDSMTKTSVNRNLAAATSLLFVTQILTSIGMFVLEAPVLIGAVVWILLWFVFAAMITLTIDWRLFPSAIGYCTAFLVTCWRLEWIAWIMVASNAVLVFNGVYVWRPKDFWFRRQRRRERS